MSSFPRDLPDLYIEVTKKNFKHSPDKVMEQCYLSNTWTTEKVYRIPSFYTGTYLIMDLHKNPHYMLYHNKRAEFDDLVQTKRHIKLVEVTKGAFEVPNEIYHYCGESKEYMDTIEYLRDDFELNKVIDMLQKEATVSKRGNWAKTIGWYGSNYTFDGENSIPKHSSISSFDSKILQLMTKVMVDLYSSKEEPLPFHSSTRTKLFAEELIRSASKTSRKNVTGSSSSKYRNVFESMTYAMTYCGKGVEEVDLLNVHIDSMNCRDTLYNMVFSIYFHTRHPETSQWLRVVFIGYSRKSIGDYFRRLNKRKQLKEHLDRYISILKKHGNRMQFSIQNSFAFEATDEHVLSMKLPFVDKCGFYSIFVSCLYDLIRTQKHTKRPLTLDDVLELSLPIAWLTTGANYYLVLKHWEKTELPEGHLTEQVVKSLLELGDSLSSGKGPRTQPFMNKPIPLNCVNRGLVFLKKMITLANKDPPANPLDKIILDIKKHVYGVGYMGAQHLLGVLTLLGVLKDVKYIRHAVVLKGTLTEKKLKKYYNQNYRCATVLYNQIGTESFHGQSRMSENIGCEFLRDIQNPFSDWNEYTYTESVKQRCNGKSIRHPDVFYSSQSIFYESKGKIYRSFYDSKGNAIIQTCKSLKLPGRQFTNTWNQDTSVLLLVKNLISEDDSSSKKTASSTQRTSCISKRRKVRSIPQKPHNYGITQDNILDMYYEHYGEFPSPESCFSKDNMKWFSGAVYEVDVNYLLRSFLKKELCVPSKKKKLGDRKKRQLIQYYKLYDIEDPQRSMLYTAYVRTHRGTSLLSAHVSTNLSSDGFMRFEIVDSKGVKMALRDSVTAFYESKETARKAMLIHEMTKKHVNGPIHDMPEIKVMLEKYTMIAIYEQVKDNITNENSFFGILAREGKNEYILYCPISKYGEILYPWEVHNIHS